jgi:hypothetical protein
MLRVLKAGLLAARTLDHLRLIIHTLGSAAEISHRPAAALWLYAWAAWLPW